MLRARETLQKCLPMVAGAFGGALLATAWGLAPVPTAQAAPQDPAVSMQIQQALSNFQIQLQSQLNILQNKIDIVERDVRQVRFELQTDAAARTTPSVPIPSDPIPGTTTWGRLVSESSESHQFVLNAAAGGVLAQLGETADGPGLILFDASGQISTALVATPRGPELRMIDDDGVLQTVLPQR